MEYINFGKNKPKKIVSDAWMYIFLELSIFALALLMIGTALLKIN